MESDFRLNLNLKQYATVQIAINFLEDRGVNNKIKQLFHNKQKYGWWNHRHGLFYEMKKWMNELVDQVELLTHIPTSMKQEIKYMIPKLGERKIAWLGSQYVRMRENFPSIIYPNLDYYCDNLHWTSIGTIDGIKTFESLYHQWSNGNSSINVFYLFEEASYYCLKDYVMKIWNECSKDDRRILSINNSGYDCDMLVKYWRWIVSGTPIISNKIFLDVKESYIRDGNVSAFQFSANSRNENRIWSVEEPENGYKHSRDVLQYYTNLEKSGKQFEQADRGPILLGPNLHKDVDLLLSTMELNKSFGESIFYANKIDLLVLLLQRMSKTTVQSLIEGNECEILFYFSAFWPWQTMTPSLLNISWNSISENDYYIYYRTVMKLESKYEETEKVFCKENLLNDSCNLQMLYQLWDITPIFFKHFLCRESYFLSDLFDAFPWTHIPFLSFMIKDEDMKPVKEEILGNYAECYINLYENQHYEIVDCFLENVLKDDKERISFKKKLHVHEIFERLLYGSNIRQRAEKFLSWLFKKKDEVIHFKRSITYEKLCEWIISFLRKHTLSQVETPKEGLQWLFDFLDYSESDMMDLRAFLKSDELFRKAFREVIHGDILKNQDILSFCCKFTPEEIEQLKKETTNEPK